MQNNSVLVDTQAFPLTHAASSWLHFLRAVAAIAVFIGHFRAVLFIDYQDIKKLNLFLKAFYFLTGFGHQAVIIFFVLSGFLIGNVVMDARRAGNWSFHRYTVDRLSRLYIVLLPALLLGFLWDNWGIAIFGLDGIYGGKTFGEHVVTTNVAKNLSILTWLGNAFFLQTIIFPAYGSNSPLWSLSYEFWYYVLFPIAVTAAETASVSKRIVLFSIVILIAAMLGSSIVMYSAVWLIGVLVSVIARHSLKRYWWPSTRIMLASALPFLLVLVFTRTQLEGIKYFQDLLLAISFGAWFFIILHTEISSPFSNLSKRLSSLSYTLYLVHLPPIIFFAASLGPHYKAVPNFEGLVSRGVIMLGITLYIYCVYFFTERYTTRIRNWLWLHT